MGLSAWAVYGLAVRFIGAPDMGRLTMALCMCAAIFAAVVVYLVMVVVTRAVTYDDMRLIPKGEKARPNVAHSVNIIKKYALYPPAK